MKRAAIYIAGGAILLLGSCGRDKISPLGSLGQPSLSDSLVYYYGLYQGSEYLREARKDTAMLSSRERERYLKGLKDGLRAVAEINDTYNNGLEEGIALALDLYAYEAKYGVTFDRELLYQSIEYALETDSLPPEGTIVGDFRNVVSKFDLKKHEEIVKEMHLSLTEEGKRLKMQKLSDDLYVTDSNKGVGPQIKKGDLVFASLNYILENGHNLEMPSSQQLIVGGGIMPEVMTRIYTRMRKGGSAQYATTAYALFGTRAFQLGLDPEEVVLMSVEINNVVDPDTTGKRNIIAD